MHIQELPIIALIVSVFALFMAGYVCYKLWKVEKVRKNFYAGDEPVNLEQILSSLASKLKNLEGNQEADSQELQRLGSNAAVTIQKIGMVRFNSFGTSGGSLSFVLALLDGSDSGVVITSMFGREQNRMYAKPIKSGTSEIMLTEEEKQAIKQAKANWQTKIILKK